jgi:hypothetical protein
MKSELEKAISELEIQEGVQPELEKEEVQDDNGGEVVSGNAESESSQELPEQDSIKQPEQTPAAPITQPESNSSEHAAIARANYEAREAKRKAAELQAEIERLKNPPKELPHPDDDLAGYTSGKIETLEQKITRLESEREQERQAKSHNDLIQSAKNEFAELENQFKVTTPDYEEARTFIVQNIARSIKLLNPAATTQELVSGVEHALLSRGSYAVNNRLNPAQSLYHEAMQLGYTKAQPVQDNKPKSNLAAVAANRSKTAGMASTSKSGAGQLTFQDVSNMTNEQRQKLTKEQWDSIVE